MKKCSCVYKSTFVTTVPKIEIYFLWHCCFLFYIIKNHFLSLDNKVNSEFSAIIRQLLLFSNKESPFFIVGSHLRCPSLYIISTDCGTLQAFSQLPFFFSGHTEKGVDFFRQVGRIFTFTPDDLRNTDSILP